MYEQTDCAIDWLSGDLPVPMPTDFALVAVDLFADAIVTGYGKGSKFSSVQCLLLDLFAMLVATLLPANKMAFIRCLQLGGMAFNVSDDRADTRLASEALAWLLLMGGRKAA